MSEPFVGEIKLFPYHYAPRGWAYCDGQQVPIQQFPTAFAVLGTRYGGNGTTTFGLPNLKGRVPVGVGRGPGLANYVLSQTGGVETIQLTQAQLPPHVHTMQVSEDLAGEASPDNQNVPGQLTQKVKARTFPQPAYSANSPSTPMNANTLMPIGGGGAHENKQPLIVIPFCICLEGLYPPRS